MTRISANHSEKSSSGRSRLLLPRGGLMMAALAALLLALWAGLIRIGWAFNPIQAALPMLHGPLMICGFLGVVIGLERAVAMSAPGLQQRMYWPYIGPALTGLGAVLLLFGGPVWLGALVITAGSAVMVMLFGMIVQQQPALYTVMMALGALCWLIGNGLWASGQPIFLVVAWWLGFPLMTIAGERLELARIRRPGVMSSIVIGALATVFVLGAALNSADPMTGTRLVGLSEVGLAVWLLRNDIARRTVRQHGLTRYIALCLLAGYFWLMVGGALAVWKGYLPAGPSYDAILHTVFVGFVMSMIFGHAPIILPAVLNLPMAYRPIFYAHLALLHGSLALRVIGDLAGWPGVRQWGGMLNAIALLIFMGNTARAVLAARKADVFTEVA